MTAVSRFASTIRPSTRRLLNIVKSAQYDGFASYFHKSKDTKLMFFTTVSFGINKAKQDAWYAYGGSKELAQKVFN